MATAIRGFQLHNNGVAIDIWPQIQDFNDPDHTIPLDPRKDNPDDSTILHISMLDTSPFFLPPKDSTDPLSVQHLHQSLSP